MQVDSTVVVPESRPEESASACSSANNGSRKPHVVVLGAGPAGVGAAYLIRRRGLADVTVLEVRDSVGGNATSFDLDGVRCDFGSHRLHPVVAPEILEDLRKLMGQDLLFRVRHGRILLRGKWIHFPLKPADLLMRLPKGFAFGIMADLARKAWPGSNGKAETFASVLEKGLGKTICREFYFPYARKLWGVAPEDLAVTTAQRRVSGSSIGKILRKVAGQIPGLRSPTAGRFYYPRHGFGQISQCLFEAARNQGAEFRFGVRVTGLDCDNGRVCGVRYVHEGNEKRISCGTVWSTVPVNLLVKGMRPAAPDSIQQAAAGLSYRGMILIYLVIKQDQFSPVDAYYFPEERIPISRLSEPKNFTGTTEPRGKTVLCAELPSDPGLPTWEMTEQELGEKLRGWMESVGLHIRSPIEKVVVHRLRHAYPVYRKGYEEHFNTIDSWASQIEGLVVLGRQGLFAHDNTHHTLEMAYRATDCLRADGTFDRAGWQSHRKSFETHVVED